VYCQVLILSYGQHVGRREHYERSILLDESNAYKVEVI